MEQKIVVVTGAGQGIGEGIARVLAAAGNTVVVADYNAETAKRVAESIEAGGGTALAVSGDVADEAQVQKMFAAATEQFGHIDVLVNNAGIFPFKAFTQMSATEWQRVMAVNVDSLFYCTQAALRIMPDNGRIISISSIASQVGFDGLTHYCASKGAVNGFTRALAVELAPRSITVNAVAPGSIETPGAGGAAISTEVQTEMLKKIPLARKGQPADIASMVRFLASAEAAYITGQIITVDGGWTVSS